jgi:molybdopterin/thiamine biosynthesis adenylyltransferase
MSVEAQQKLLAATVVLIGLGGAGCACASYLVAAGIGRLLLVDSGSVTTPDLNEQTLFLPEDVGKLKVQAAKTRLQAINPAARVECQLAAFDTYNAERTISAGSIVIDSMSNWQDKLTASDACMQMGRTLVHAGVRAFEFHVYTMIPGKSACLRCLLADIGMEDVVSSPEPQGALGPVAGMAGAFQAIEAIKIIAGIGTTPGSNLIRFDALRRYVQQITELRPTADCPDCGRVVI